MKPRRAAGGWAALALACGAACGCAGPDRGSASERAPLDGGLVAAHAATLAIEGARAEAVAFKDGVAYVGLGEQGLAIVDVSRPDAPRLLARLDKPATDALALSEDLLFALEAAEGAFGDGAVRSFDVLDPRNPLLLHETTLDEPARSIAAERGLVAVAGGDAGLVLSSSRTLARVETGFTIDGSVDAVLLERGLVAAFGVADDGGFFGDPERFLALVGADDRRLRARIAVQFDDVLAGEDGITGAQHDLARSGDVLLVTTGQHVRPFDVADPEKPAALPALRLQGAGPIAADGTIAAAVGTPGILLLDLADPRAPRPAGWADTPAGLEGQADVALAGDLLLVADGAAGLTLLRIARAEAPVALDGAHDRSR